MSKAVDPEILAIFTKFENYIAHDDWYQSALKLDITKAAQKVQEHVEYKELIAFIAGCLQHGMADEDTEIYIKAYKIWKESLREQASAS